MKEGESQPQPPSRSSWEAIVSRISAAKKHAQEIQETSKEFMQHPEILEGSEAALRSALNVAISCADIVPGAGELASWGADALKVFEDIQFRIKQKDAITRGENPLTVQHKKYNLTPDVHVLVATLTEALEFVTFFTAPTHAIETTFQLWYDIPRIGKGIRKAREVLVHIRKRREQARIAAEHFLPYAV